MTNEDTKKPSKPPPPLPPRKATQESLQEAALKKAQEATSSKAENGRQFANDYFPNRFFFLNSNSFRNEKSKW